MTSSINKGGLSVYASATLYHLLFSCSQSSHNSSSALLRCSGAHWGIFRINSRTWNCLFSSPERCASSSSSGFGGGN